MAQGYILARWSVGPYKPNVSCATNVQLTDGKAMILQTTADGVGFGAGSSS